MERMDCTPRVRRQDPGHFPGQSPCRGFPPISAGFRRVAPSSKRPLFPKDWRFPAFPAFPPLVFAVSSKGHSRSFYRVAHEGPAAPSRRTRGVASRWPVEGWAAGTGHGWLSCEED